MKNGLQWFITTLFTVNQQQLHKLPTTATLLIHLDNFILPLTPPPLPSQQKCASTQIPTIFSSQMLSKLTRVKLNYLPSPKNFSRYLIAFAMSFFCQTPTDFYIQLIPHKALQASKTRKLLNIEKLVFNNELKVSVLLILNSL